MAGGNLGDLFISLGIKDEMSKTLQKIVKGMNGVDQATQDAKKRGEELVASLNSINGNNFSKIFREANEYIEKNTKGVANIAKILKGTGFNDTNILTGKFLGAGNLAKIASLFGTINSELQRMSKNEDDADRVKDWQNRISNALAYIKLLQDINIQEKKISNTKAENPNVDTKSLDNAKKSLNELRESIISLIHSGGVDDSNVLSSLTKVLGMAKKDVQDIISTFKKDNPLSAFTGGAAKVEADIARVTEKLAKLRDLTSEGTSKGYKTSMLGGSITELDNILSRLNAAKLNPTMLTDAAQMKNLISDVLVETIKATVAIQAYNREKGKVIDAQRIAEKNRSRLDTISGAEKRQEKLISSTNILLENIDKLNTKSISLGVDTSKLDYIRQEIERIKYDIGSFAGKDLLGQSFKNAITELSTWREKANAALKGQSKENASVRADERQLEQTEARFRRVKELLSEVNRKIVEYNASFDKGLKIGADVSKIQNAIIGLSHFYDKLNQVNVGDKKAVLELISEYRILTNKIGDAKAAQDKLNSSVERINKSTDRQLSTDLENSKRRIQSLDKALKNLQEKTFTSKMLGLDVSEATAKIAYLKGQLDDLRILRDRLERGDKTAVGQLGNLGNGREVQAANNLAASYDKANKEAQRGVEIERKRQQEIAQSAEKARNDLAAAFAGVNAEAKKMQSIVGDIKSLFLQGGIVFGAQQFFNSIVKTGGEIVQQHIALRSIIGDVQKADELFNQTQQLALQSPFKFGELNRDVKQLAAFGVEAKDLYETTKRLADIASGLGVDFGRLGLAFGQVKARSWLDGKELRQFAYAGLPLLQKITELYNAEGKNNRKDYTQSDVKEMISKRMVSFEDVQKVLWKMTDEGGQFYNMQFVLSETLLGKWNKLIDAWEIMLGKFADGDNIVGGFFKLAISGVTELVLALDKMSPAILSMGAVRLLRMLGKNNFGFSKLTNRYSEQVNTQLKAYAIEQQQLVTEKKITQEKALQNVQARAYMLADRESQIATYSRMALEGKLSVNQMNRLLREGLITKELVQQLSMMGMINASQERAIISGSRLSAIWSTAKTKFGSALSFVGGWWGLAIGAVFGIWSSISQEMDEVEQKAKDLQDANSEWMKPYYDILSQNKASNNSELKKQVDLMKQFLISNDAYTKKLDDQIAKAKSLNEQYDILKSGVDSAKDRAYDDASVVANAIGSTGGMMSGKPFNDTITENINDMHESMAKLDIQLSALDENTKVKMESIANSLLAPADRSKTLADKIRILSEEGGQRWSTFQANMVKWNCNIAFSMTRIKGAAEDVTSDIQEIANDDVPAIVNSIQKDLGLFGNDFRNFCKTQPDRFRNMLLQIASDADWLVPQIRKKLEELTGFKFPDKGKITADTPLNSMQRRVYKNLGGNQKQYDLISSYLEDGSYYKTKNNLQNALQDLYNEYKSRSKGGATKSEIAEAKRLYDELNDAAFKGVGYKFIPQDKKSNKVPKSKTGSQEDKQLKNLRDRIDLYKKMYAEIKKYKELYGEGALGQLANDGEFKSIFNDKDNFPISDYTNYETSIKELLKGFPLNTVDRKHYYQDQLADIQTEHRKLTEDQRKDELNALNRQLDVISEQYETYKKIYELTGNKKGSENIAFGGTVQFDTYKRFLEEQLDIAVKHDNVQSHLNLTTDEVKGMSLENVKDKYGEETRVYDIRKKLEDENNKIKKETIDLMANLIEKNATIAQQIEDENRKYEKQLELIKGIEDPQMRDRAKAGATKTHDENVAKLQFEQFKQESDWVTIFDDLDRVSSATINSMIEKIDQFSMTTGLSVESIKQLRDALDKLRNEQISRNPFPSVFGGVKRGNAIGKFINERLGGMDDTAKIFVSKDDASRLGIAGGERTKASLKNDQQSAYADSSKAISELATKMQALNTVLDPVINLFKAMGEEDSILGQIIGGASGAFSSAASTAGAFDTLSKMKGLGFLEGAGPYAAAASAALSIGGSLIKAFGADYSSYEKAKAEYDNLTLIWDSLISKKTEYMNIHWGTEATEASKEAQEMLKAEIEQTKVIAQKRLNSGSSAGSHSIWYRMWKGSYKYNGLNWRDVAGDISSKYGVKFNGMEDMLNMNADTLSEIKKNYTGLWATMDSDFREYLEKLIQYGEKADDMIEALTEKLTGNKFSDLVSSWGDAMSAMANSSDNLVDYFGGNLKKTILESMIENIYGDKIKALLKKTQGYAENDDKIKDSNGNVISEYTGAEYADVNKNTEELSKQIEATRDYLKKVYGWSDNSSSSSRNSVKGITEEQGDVFLSYVNGIRLDCSVMRAEQAKYYPEMSEIAKSQLTQLNVIAQNTLRNADAAERIERIFVEYNDNFNRVLNGTKSLKMK